MFHLTATDFIHLISTYGYWAILLAIAIESTGIPFPGEAMLLAASIYGGTTHQLSLPLIILAAAAGAILGDNLGYLVGHEGGYRLLRRYGHVIRIKEKHIKLGQYLFLKHGSKVVFFGRFVAVLRAWAAFLAGTNRMHWKTFLLFNALGGILWATIFGCGGYLLGHNFEHFSGPVGLILAGIAAILIITGFIFFKRNEARLTTEAEKALPGPIDHIQSRQAIKQ